MSSGNKTLDEFMHYVSSHFKMLKQDENSSATPILEVKVLGYSKRIGLACNLIKMCAYVAQPHARGSTDQLEDPRIDISSVLELALELISQTELEVLDEIHQMLMEDRENKMELITKNER